MNSGNPMPAARGRLLSLVLEDDTVLAGAYGRVLESLGYEVVVCHTIASARIVIRDRGPELMLIDIDLPDGNGLDLMNELRSDVRGRFVVISGDGSQRAAIKSIRNRAVEILIKPVSLQQLKQTLSSDVSLSNDSQSNGRDRCWIRAGSHHSLASLRTAISYCAEHGRGHALITGPSGVDKPSVSREIHRRGRRMGACIVVDCSLEKGSTGILRMFGQEDPKTGSVVHAGYIDQAAAGTLVLDSVEQLSIETQSRLMPLLDSGTYRRVGAVQGAQATLSIVGIARKQGTADGDESELRSDFLYRLAKTTLVVPSLRECSNDLEEIAYLILNSVLPDGATNPVFSEASLNALTSYDWPRNVRELRSFIQRSLGSMESGQPLELTPILGSETSATTASDIAPWVGGTLWEMEKQLLEATLSYCSGDKEVAAQMLGMSLKTLYNRINTYH